MNTKILVGLAAVVVVLTGWMMMDVASGMAGKGAKVEKPSVQAPLPKPGNTPEDTTSGSAQVEAKVKVNADNVKANVQVLPKR